MTAQLANKSFGDFMNDLSKALKRDQVDNVIILYTVGDDHHTMISGFGSREKAIETVECLLAGMKETKDAGTA